MANDSIRGRQVVLRLTNKSGGGLVEGDVVIVDSTTAASVTTTTTAGLATDAVGVALETIAGDAIGRICISGYVPKINLSGAASLGDTLTTHTVAKQAAPSGTRGAGTFGEVLGTGTTPAALLWGVPDSSSAGGSIATDTIWDAAGDLVQGTGSNTAGRLAIGTANQLLRVNAGATAVEWASVGRVFIAEKTPTNTTAQWTSIPNTYTHLVIEYIARADKAASTTETMNLYFNGDTTVTNYYYTACYALDASAFGNEGDSPLVGVIPAVSSAANDAGVGSIWIPYYKATTFNKAALTTSTERRTASTQSARITSIFWEATTAISQIDIITAGSNFIAGSTFRLYGVF